MVSEYRMSEYVGYVAGLLTVSAFLPQVAKAWRSRHTRDLSWLMIVLLIVSGTLWLAYGMLTHDLPLVATNAGMITLNLLILWAKVRFDGHLSDEAELLHSRSHSP